MPKLGLASFFRSFCVSDQAPAASLPTRKESTHSAVMASNHLGTADTIRRYPRDFAPDHFTVEIKSYSSLSKTHAKKYESTAFDAGGHKWRLSLYPNETIDGNSYISLFLAMADTKTGIAKVWNAVTGQGGSDVYATFRLFVFDQTHKKYLTIEDGKVRHFTEERNELGFRKFLRHATFKESYLLNDSCIFGAEVFVHHQKPKESEESLFLRELTSPTGTIHFRVVSFSSKQNQDYLSEEFTVEGRKWKLRVYPKGNEEKNKSLSLFLVSTEDWKTHASVYGEFKLRVVDQLHNKNSIEKTVKHWFWSSSNEFGCPSFMGLKTLHNSMNGYVRNDELIVEVEFRVVSAAVNAPPISKKSIVM